MIANYESEARLVFPRLPSGRQATVPTANVGLVGELPITLKSSLLEERVYLTARLKLCQILSGLADRLREVDQRVPV